MILGWGRTFQVQPQQPSSHPQATTDGATVTGKIFCRAEETINC